MNARMKESKVNLRLYVEHEEAVHGNSISVLEKSPARQPGD